MDVAALAERARQVLDPPAFDYYAGGADDEVTVADNEAAWLRLRMRPRVLRDVSSVATSTTVLGHPVTVPVLIAPVAYQRMAHPDGEAGMAAAAARAGTVMVVSTLATTSLEDVAAAEPHATKWFQLYVHRDRDFTAELAARARAAGYHALVLTVDTPMLGSRRRDERNSFRLPAGLSPANVPRYTVDPPVGASELAAYATAQFDASLAHRDLAWLREISPLPLVVKGVVRGDDAAMCVDAGAAAVVVSNHGGRQLDTCIATADALEEVCTAVAGRAEVYVDGGIRRGTDVVKALALGARAVLVGRPALWALATGGSAGVTALLDELAAQTRRAMALCGAAGLDDIGRDLVVARH